MRLELYARVRDVHFAIPVKRSPNLLVRVVERKEDVWINAAREKTRLERSARFRYGHFFLPGSFIAEIPSKGERKERTEDDGGDYDLFAGSRSLGLIFV